ESASQVDVSNDLSKPVTTHYMPKRREFAPAKPHNMIATSSSRLKPTGRVFKNVVLRWVPTGKQQRLTVNPQMVQMQISLTNVKANKLLMSAQAPFLIVQMTFEQRSSSLVLHQMTSDHNRSELGIQDHSNEQTSSKLVPKVVPLAVKTASSRQVLGLLFHHHIVMLRTTGK
ncbi:hypothetical protein Tco_0027556, partial [Tanacetum coccineum]